MSVKLLSAFVKIGIGHGREMSDRQMSESVNYKSVNCGRFSSLGKSLVGKRRFTELHHMKLTELHGVVDLLTTSVSVNVQIACQ